MKMTSETEAVGERPNIEMDRSDRKLKHQRERLAHLKEIQTLKLKLMSSNEIIQHLREVIATIRSSCIDFMPIGLASIVLANVWEYAVDKRNGQLDIPLADKIISDFTVSVNGTPLRLASTSMASRIKKAIRDPDFLRSPFEVLDTHGVKILISKDQIDELLES